MSSPDPAIIEKIIAEGGAEELHRMLLGISQFSSPETKSLQKLSAEDELSMIHATHHLEFVCRHGTRAFEGMSPIGKIETGKPVHFSEWLKRGMPGLVWEEVLSYLASR